MVESDAEKRRTGTAALPRGAFVEFFFHSSRFLRVKLKFSLREVGLD